MKWPRGCTYKENVDDTRETPVRDVIRELHEYQVEVYGYDPLIRDGEKHFGIKFLGILSEAPKVDCIILTVVHDVFKEIRPDKLLDILNPGSVIIDVRGVLDTPEIRKSEVIYERL